MSRSFSPPPSPPPPVFPQLSWRALEDIDLGAECGFFPKQREHVIGQADAAVRDAAVRSIWDRSFRESSPIAEVERRTCPSSPFPCGSVSRARGFSFLLRRRPSPVWSRPDRRPCGSRCACRAACGTTRRSDPCAALLVGSGGCGGAANELTVAEEIGPIGGDVHGDYRAHARRLGRQTFLRTGRTLRGTAQRNSHPTASNETLAVKPPSPDRNDSKNNYCEGEARNARTLFRESAPHPPSAPSPLCGGDLTTHLARINLGWPSPRRSLIATGRRWRSRMRGALAILAIKRSRDAQLGPPVFSIASPR